jgi:hypothetical protein
VFCCSVSVCRPSRQKGREAGRPAGVVFRGHRARPPVKRPSEGDRAKQAEGSEAEKDLKTARISSNHIRVSGRVWRDSWPPHEACQGSILPPVSTIQDVECSGMKARASGAVRWRRCNGAKWKRQELAESGSLPGGSLRFCQRRQPEQQKSQSVAAPYEAASSAMSAMICKVNLGRPWPTCIT